MTEPPGEPQASQDAPPAEPPPPPPPPAPDEPVQMPPPEADAAPPEPGPPVAQAGEQPPPEPAAPDQEPPPADDQAEPPPPAADVPSPEPEQPVPPTAPPVVPQTVGAANANPVLPHNSLAGVSRAAALFERVFTIADDASDTGAGEMAVALARIRGICEAAIGDVGRFAPEGMREAAAGEAEKLIRSV